MGIGDIFAKLKRRALEGMVFHDEMVRYYSFLNCDHRRLHEEQYREETKGYRKLCDYYMSRYNELIPVEPMDRPNVIPDSWYRYTRQDVDDGTRRNAIRSGIAMWVDW